MVKRQKVNCLLTETDANANKEVDVLKDKISLINLHDGNYSNVVVETEVVQSDKRAARVRKQRSSRQNSLAGRKMTTSTEGFIVPPPASENDENKEESVSNEKVAAIEKPLYDLEVLKRSFGRPLPKHYETLYHLFVSMETVVAVSFNRDSRITLETVTRNVVRNTKRDFTEDHLSQILYVYPQCYKVWWEKRRQARKGDVSATAHYDLVLKPIFNEDRARLPNNRQASRPDLVSPVKLISPVKRRTERDFHRKSPTKTPVLPRPRPAAVDPSLKMNGQRLTDRKMRFRHFLVMKVDEAVVEYLSAKKLPVVCGANLPADFDLDMCPPIGRSPLPDLPVSMTPLRSAYDYFKIVPQPAKTPERELPESSRLPLSEKTPERDLPPAIDENLLKSPLKGALQAIATPSIGKTPKLSLLERIRAKEAAKKSVDESKIRELEKRCDQLHLLNTTLVEVICSHFQLGNRRSMNVRQLMSLVLLVCSQLNKDTFMEHIDVLCESSGGICTKETLRSNVFLKMTEIRVDKLRICVEDALERAQRELRTIKSA